MELQNSQFPENMPEEKPVVSKPIPALILAIKSAMKKVSPFLLVVKNRTASLFGMAKAKFMSWSAKVRVAVLVGVVLVIGGVVFLTVKPFSKAGMSVADKIKIQEDNILFKGKSAVTAKMGETANLGSLKIDFYNVKEADYTTFELDKDQKRIIKKYFAAQINVFNTGSEKTENILIGLKDDRGNTYRLDYSVPFYIADTRDFGRNMMIFPRIMQDGYIFFSNVDEKAKDMELIFALTATKEKAVFKFEKK